MTQFPDFSESGYQIKKELGRNVAGGRVTYLAKRILPQASSTPAKNPADWVVIKQFQFATTTSNWSDFKAHEREIQVLQSLDNPGIPKYLDSFETPTGFCMVQEYKKANSLAVLRSFNPEQIKQIALDLLEILVYLQSLNPVVIHRDFKPENILVAESSTGSLEVYLVDFGFAQLGGGEVTMSSMVKGTLGFMAPEQLFNRSLTPASDLYGLGASLICLLTSTKSVEVGNLLDEDYHFQFRELLPQLSRRWLDWLEKMVQPDPMQRYVNAAQALAALKPIYVNRTPEVSLSQSRFELSATTVGEKLRVRMWVKNPVPETMLVGWWEVAPHDADIPQLAAGNDPDGRPPFERGELGDNKHPWITFTPSRFEGNRVDCEIEIDTSQLRTGQVYSRQLLLQTNAVPETQTLPLTVKTAPIPIAVRKLPYGFLGLLFLVAAGGSMVAVESMTTLLTVTIAGFATWAGLSRMIRGVNPGLKAVITFITTAIVAGVAGFSMGVVAGATATGLWATAIAAATTVATAAALVGTANQVRKNFGIGWAIGLCLLTVMSGMTLGLGLKLQLLASFWFLAIATTTPLLALIFILPASDRRRLAQYRQSEQHLIES
jgi:serine/threonine protein kinase